MRHTSERHIDAADLAVNDIHARRASVVHLNVERHWFE